VDSRLKNSDPQTPDADERQRRRLATVAYWAFTEHTGITQRILREIKA
jgi:hypothetical protein